MNNLKHCPVCGKPFSDLKHKGRVYCSSACANIAKRRVETRTCPVCGKGFSVKPSSKQVCCSHSCDMKRSERKDPSKKVVKLCEYCAKAFETWAYRNARYCSSRCASSANCINALGVEPRPESYIHRSCVVCGAIYTIHQGVITTSGRNSVCCSRGCWREWMSKEKRGANNPNYRGGAVQYRGANWGMQRRAALRRDGHKCQICGMKLREGRRWNYGVHHIKPYREFNGDFEAANQLTNLISLCRSCHGKVESGKLACPRPLF